MPLKLNVGLSKKVGQPGYSSLGASCNVEVELEPSLLSSDPEGFHRHVRNAFVACREAVMEELSRHQPSSGNSHNGNRAAGNNGTASSQRNGNAGKSAPAARRGTPTAKPPAPMSTAQRRAIDAIAERVNADAGDECRRVFNLDLDRLTVRDASALIDHLKSLEPPLRRNGGTR